MIPREEAQGLLLEAEDAFTTKRNGGFVILTPEYTRHIIPMLYYEEGELCGFDKALLLLKDKKHATRESWRKRGVYIFLIDPDGGDYWSYTNGINDNHIVEPFIAIKLSSGTVQPWVASQGDLLAKDWQVFETLPVYSQQRETLR